LECLNKGGRDLISADPLSPGTVYTAGVTSDGTVGLYRLEVSISGGNGKLKMAGGISGAMKESVQRAFSYVQAKIRRNGSVFFGAAIICRNKSQDLRSLPSGGRLNRRYISAPTPRLPLKGNDLVVRCFSHLLSLPMPQGII
jgi:hypothetical protein